MSHGGEEPPWSLQAGIDPEAWPEAARTATTGLRQGFLVAAPPLVYAANPDEPIHNVSRLWARSSSATTGAVNVRNEARRPPYGLIVTQTCDLVEEGKPKRPWIQIAPVYELTANRGDITSIQTGRGFAYLVPITTLEPRDGAIWVADLRLLVAVEKGWLVGRKTCPGFANEEGYRRLASQLATLFSRTAYARVVIQHVLEPTHALLREIVERYEGEDPIAEVGLSLGRSPADPVNAELVFLLDAGATRPDHRVVAAARGCRTRRRTRAARTTLRVAR